MFFHVRIEENGKKKGSKNYHCVNCGAYIANSASSVTINGSGEHSFVNPAGVQCNFKTFLECSNVEISDELFLEHSWFPGFGWRFLICSDCSRHLGWKYDPVNNKSAEAFFGVLIHAVQEVSEGG